MEGHEQVVSYLVSKHVDLETGEQQGTQSPLYMAAKNGHEANVRVLLATGKFDVNFKNEEDGETPLYAAVVGGYLAVVRLVLDTHEADVDARDKHGWTPLMYAVRDGMLSDNTLHSDAPDQSIVVGRWVQVFHCVFFGASNLCMPKP
jgi:ankyrin repeat protein